MSTRLKDGPITDKSGQPDEIGDQPSLCGKSLIVQMNSKFLSVTVDGSLRSPTGGVKGIQPAPQNHEQNGQQNSTEKLWLR